MCFVSILPAYLAYWMQYRQRLAHNGAVAVNFLQVQYPVE